MSELQLLGTNEEQSSIVSMLNNPFQKDGIQTVWIYARKSTLTGEVSWEGWVNFKVDTTEGKHTVSGPDFASVVKQLDTLIKSL